MIHKMGIVGKVIMAFCLLQFTNGDEVKVLSTFSKRYNFGGQGLILNSKETYFSNPNTILISTQESNGTQSLFINEIDGDTIKYEKSCNLKITVPGYSDTPVFGIGNQYKHLVVFFNLQGILSNSSQGPPKKLIYVYKILNLDTCKVSELIVPLNDKDINSEFNLKVYMSGVGSIMPYMKGEQVLFDAFFPNYDQCEGAICKITFDSQGKLVSGPVGYAPEVPDVYAFFVSPFSTRAESRNYLATLGPIMESATSFSRYGLKREELSQKFKDELEKVNFEYANLKILRHDGKNIDLPERIYTNRDYNDKYTCRWDASNEYLSFCETQETSSKIKCTQRDTQGNKKLEATLLVEKDSTPVKIERVLNTSEHGLLIVTQMPHRYMQKLYYKLVLRQIKADGTEGKSYDLPYNDCKQDYSDAGLFEVSKNKYCLAVTCESEVTNKCFSL